MSAGSTQAAIEAAVRREVERYRRRHGRPWADIVHRKAGADDPLSDAGILADMVGAATVDPGLYVPPSSPVALRGLVHSMLRMAQRMGGKPGEVTY